MLALYILSLAGSAALTGLFVRQVSGELGLVHGFRVEVLLAAGVACVYICTQFLYMAAVRFLKPTRSSGALFAETLSHFAALALVPYVLSLRVPWPHPVLYKVEPLVYLGGFAAVHCSFKLVSFYAAIRGEPSGRLGALAWLLASGLSAFAAYSIFQTWTHETEELHGQLTTSLEPHRVGDTYAWAQAIPEGLTMSFDINSYDGQCLTMRWANLPTADEDTEVLERIHVTITLEGIQPVRWSWTVNVDASRWAEVQVPPERIPDGVRGCSIVWDMKKLPAWRRILGVRPVATSHRRMLLSGPFQHQMRDLDAAPNFLVVALEGLGAQRLSCLGYQRNTTPFLDRLAQTALVFPNAYSPAPEAAAACMTLLTGVDPLRHGHLGAHHGPLPEAYETLAEVLGSNHYVTAAFTEGEGTEELDLAFGSGFERGFEVFDPSYHPATSLTVLEPEDTEPPAGSKVTLDKVKAWINDHARQKYFVFVRLRELGEPSWCDRYAPGFVEAPAKASPADVYDSALAYIDMELGALLKHVRASAAGKHTCVLVTSPYGLDFSAGPRASPTVGLTEGSLRVPLLLDVPGLSKENRPRLVGLDDVAPTLLNLAQTGFDYVVDGNDLIENPKDKEPISLFGEPLTLSLRVDRWRFSWQSGRVPFTDQVTGEEGNMELYDVFQAEQRGKRDAAAEHPELVDRYRASLESYLNERATSWNYTERLK